MGKRAKIAIAVSVVTILWVVTWQVLCEREPAYEGKRLRGWLRDYHLGLNTSDPERVSSRNVVEVAVRQIGTNAIPTLLRMAAQKDSSFTSKLIGTWDRRIVWNFSLPTWFRYPSWYRNQARVLNDEAVLGFEILGAGAQQAVPSLIKIYEQNISSSSQAATSRALVALGPTAQRMAIPSFLQEAASSNAPAREVAIWSLSAMDSEPALVVPALVKALSDTNYVIRLVAAKGLGRFGTNAQQAVPALVQLLRDPNVRVRPNATNALRKIDPGAAAKAGVDKKTPREEAQVNTHGENSAGK